MEVFSASCVGEALEFFERARPHVIVSDLGLPDADGYSFIRRVRELGADAAALPAVAVTAFVEPEARRRALLAGFQACLPKPLELSELVDLLERLRISPAMKRAGSS